MTLLTPVGCTDGDAQQRDDVQKAIVAAQQKLHKIRLESAAFAPDQLDGLKQKFEAISRELTAITGGDPGQQAARAMLTATALRELADVSLARASEIEARLQDQRTVVAARIDVMQVLDAVAAGYTSINPQTDLEMLSLELGIAQERLGALAQKLAELEGPIAERTGANTKAAEEVNRLKTEVGELQRQADEQGYARGFPLQQKAIQTQREADKIEYDISLREMALAYDYQAEAD
jgi:predicted  nucleic acid-binding Zn-ribbon protein